MSIQSRQRSTKRPTSSVKDTHAPGPDRHLIPVSNIGLIPPRDKKTTGAFGGVTVPRRRKLLRDRNEALIADEQALEQSANRSAA